ncbi:efflux RND transporter periplasmic adaptor subunit [Trichocoleus sp. FACHB-591]|uniref:efflux RND transporter periplasmic adaptor subunit n=1 Tax=Trichocoleus sp. FACHB-591 TaxID=2692872 RepID=UPI001685BD98|nr:efflux RND transporter periplasmic adaptor subunit [Trichocoleus sp. FACHB-591]MBD2094651.1 efflux RND transporter periplasmic adaptor subunit [Trichocoleus sp. FACHB-591]
MPQSADVKPQTSERFPLLLASRALLLMLLVTVSGCGIFTKADAEAPRQQNGGARGGPTPVDVAIAETGSLQENLEFTGTTQPLREVSLRAQVEGQLLDLLVDAGDTVGRGQTVAQLDASLLATSVTEAQAELATRQSEVAQAEAEVNDARTQVEEARLQLQQAQSDAARLQQLLREGAIAAQLAEQAQTEARTAAQALRSAQEQVRTRQQAVVAAQGRVAAQRAVVAQANERQSYATLSSPVTGVVLKREMDPGTLVQPGTEILRLGDLSSAKVIVNVADKQLGTIRQGQDVRVSLDAFPNQVFSGEVTRITPVANALYVPIEVTIPNENGRVGSGLFARVSFVQGRSQRVVVPESAIQSERGQRDQQGQQQRTNATSNATLFVVDGNNQEPKAVARSVTLGQQANGKVEILSGLRVGEEFVARSGRPLKDGAPVRLSILSETQPGQTQKPTQSTQTTQPTRTTQPNPNQGKQR